MSKPKYTVEPGRVICRDGKPMFYLGRLVEERDGSSPHELDAATRAIAKLLEENHDRVVCDCGRFFEAIPARSCKTSSLHKE